MALPAHSSLAEFLDELLALCSAPLLTRPWQALTASGKTIDAAVPLSRTGLRDGDALLLSPQQELPPPVLLDATEALTEETSRATRPVPPLCLAHAAANVSLLVLVIALSHWVPLWCAFLPSVAAALLLTLWARPLPGVMVTGTLCAAAAGFLWIRQGQPHHWLVYALLVGLLSAATAVVILGLAARGLPIRVISSTATACALGLAAVAAWLSIGTLSGAAALTLLLGFFTVLSAPRLSTACAGLTPPRLPSAGQDLEVSDAHRVPPDQTQHRARHARLIYEGLHLGVVCVTCPALVAVGFSAQSSPAGVGFSAAVLCGFALVFLLHGLRHPHPYVLWSHIAVVLSAIAALGITASSHLALMFFASFLCFAGISLPWWLPHLPSPGPTHLLWWERVESLTIAAVIPLCLHLAGVFVFVRGLSL